MPLPFPASPLAAIEPNRADQLRPRRSAADDSAAITDRSTHRQMSNGGLGALPLPAARMCFGCPVSISACPYAM
jgi:hypothetical protein